MISHGGGSLIDRIGGGVIPELTADPTSPNPQQAWVLKQGGQAGGNGGVPIGLMLLITDAGQGGSATTYQFSYYTLEGTIKRVTLS